MAYKKKLCAQICQRIRCPSKATYDVFNKKNKLVGEYCTKHANETIQKLNMKE